jgi:hypothetical protein
MTTTHLRLATLVIVLAAAPLWPSRVPNSAAGGLGRPLGQSPAPPRYRDLPSGLLGTAPFAVVGDPQQSLFWETAVMGREDNAADRSRLFAALGILRPAFLVITGDLTAVGASERRWQFFDGLTASLRAEETPILPVLGNHDYWGSNVVALQRFSARFAQFRHSHWYTRRYGSLALVFLDANAAELGPTAWRQQEQWLVSTLATLDADSAIAGVLVFEHQPPFTNSTVTSDDAAVQRAFVPAFVRARKTLAMISGHTHGYEHFVEQGKHFVVSGGGGGPRVALRSGADAVHRDLFSGPSPRPFHALWITPEAHGVRVEVRGFARGETALRLIDRFTISW